EAVALVAEAVAAIASAAFAVAAIAAAALAAIVVAAVGGPGAGVTARFAAALAGPAGVGRASFGSRRALGRRGRGGCRRLGCLFRGFRGFGRGSGARLARALLGAYAGIGFVFGHRIHLANASVGRKGGLQDIGARGARMTFKLTPAGPPRQAAGPAEAPARP